MYCFQLYCLNKLTSLLRFGRLTSNSSHLSTMATSFTNVFTYPSSDNMFKNKIDKYLAKAGYT